MQSNYLKTSVKTAVLAIASLLLLANFCSAQSVSLSAQRTTLTLPDGQVVPMWGLFCSSATTPVNASCTSLKTDASGAFLAQSGTSWQPPMITVTSGTNLTITLANGLPVPTADDRQPGLWWLGKRGH